MKKILLIFFLINSLLSFGQDSLSANKIKFNITAGRMVSTEGGTIKKYYAKSGKPVRIDTKVLIIESNFAEQRSKEKNITSKKVKLKDEGSDLVIIGNISYYEYKDQIIKVEGNVVLSKGQMKLELPLLLIDLKNKIINYDENGLKKELKW